jgi:hypothetical protein
MFDGRNNFVDYMTGDTRMIVHSAREQKRSNLRDQVMKSPLLLEKSD